MLLFKCESVQDITLRLRVILDPSHSRTRRNVSLTVWRSNLRLKWIEVVIDEWL